MLGLLVNNPAIYLRWMKITARFSNDHQVFTRRVVMRPRVVGGSSGAETVSLAYLGLAREKGAWG